ncbi:MAG TPA: hypothetical protein VMI13_11095 [Solirubrobacteraceae bacterium]|nr:hypothetical protein [Solirubrobacteraceae bacterium]
MSSAAPRVLFFTADHEDYLADGLMHGLRGLLGDRLVDYPKAEFMYSSFPAERHGELYGRGFTLYRTLPDIEVDRNRPLQRAIEGRFDLIVFADIWSSFGRFVEVAPWITTTPMAVLDGADRQEPYPYAGEWWRKRAWWMLPRAHTRAIYFKRELTPLTGWFRSYLLLPPAIAQWLPSIRRMRPTAFSFPAEKILAEAPADKRSLLATHVVDPEVAARTGAPTSYAFDEETDYYEDLRRARYGITVKRAGWDCMRHYELAANGCVPCFRALRRKPPRCAPHGLNETNCVEYESYDELMERLDEIHPKRYLALQEGALRWARENSTLRRAGEFLRSCGFDVPAARGREVERAASSQ